MNPFAPIVRVPAARFTSLPQSFRVKARSEWADANKRGAEIDSFLEGPSFDRAGNLYCVDIPFGRIFRISPAGEWTLVARYDGWPNGLKIARDGRIFVTDYRHGIMTVDPASGALAPVLRAFRSEGFKGVNDLHFAANGDLYFTDQGQTGWNDPTGRVFRLGANGALDLLCDTIPSPNGLVLDLTERVLFVAVTRANAIWRLPLFGRGPSPKVGTFIQMSGGTSGPDGLALDEEGGIVCAHAGLGVWRFDALGLPTHFVGEPGSFVTNIAFGGPDRRTLYMTESETGEILTATMPAPGKVMASHL